MRVRMLAALAALSVGCGEKSVSPSTSATPATPTTTSTEPPGPPSRTVRTLATVQAPHGVAVSDGFVYTISVDYDSDLNGAVAGKLIRVPIGGGDTVELQTQLPSPSSVAVAGGVVAWFADDVESDSDPLMLLANGKRPARTGSAIGGNRAIATAPGGFVYLSNAGEWAMRFVQSDGRGDRVITKLDTKQHSDYLTVLGEAVYWQCGRSICATKLADGSGKRFDPSDHVNFRGFAADSTHLYWTDWGELPASGGSGGVYRSPLGGGAAEAFAVGFGGHPWGIAIVDDAVYWTANKSDGALFMKRKSGTKIHAVARGQGNPTELVYAGGALYWANAESGEIQSLTL